MTLKELKEKVDKLIERHGDDTVVVPTTGIGGPASPVKSVCAGFDWYQGCILLHTETLLAPARDEKAYEYLFHEFLLKVSNYKKVNCGEKVAKFRTETRAFERHSAAAIWLYDRLKQEISDKTDKNSQAR